MKIASENIDITLPKSAMVEIVDEAKVDSHPVRPNKPLNIALGIIIGLVQDLTSGYENNLASFIAPGIHTITPYLVMILVLLIRPYGLFGTRKVERI